MQVTIAKTVDQKCIAKAVREVLQRGEKIKPKKAAATLVKAVRHVDPDMLGDIGSNLLTNRET